MAPQRRRMPKAWAHNPRIMEDIDEIQRLQYETSAWRQNLKPVGRATAGIDQRDLATMTGQQSRCDCSRRTAAGNDHVGFLDVDHDQISPGRKPRFGGMRFEACGLSGDGELEGA